ncbi:MAG: ATP-dependent zinc metalloprotease FtsH [Campylobacteraceae bacterium]|jgi:cell division protease FtsH|nr:ATP-dependent zinc metalloprotease FtsH [Campylobacteraceae bacterium]
MEQKNSNNKPPQNNNFFNKNPLFVFFIFSLVVIFVFKTFVSPSSDTELTGGGNLVTKDINYYDFKELVKNDKIESVGIGPTTIRAVSKDTLNSQKTSYMVKKVGEDSSLLPLLEEKKVPYGGYSESSWLGDILSWMLPIFIFFAIWMFLANRMQKNMGGGILGMGNSKKLVNSEKPKVKFSDVAGVEEAKEEVVEIVDFLRHPDRYIRLGAKIPKGVLLVGPPGTGKTLLAKAVAGEADVPFFSVSGSSFIEMFVGVGASRVRDLFDNAKKEAPAIVFIDEIDAIGKSRAAGGQLGGNDEREQTLNQLLAEMDGFSSDSSPVIVLAATNRPEVLDAALLRPGRFDRQVLVDRPDLKGRLAILQVHIKDIKLSKDVNLEEIAIMTVGFAGADLANVINEAALLAGRESKEYVEQKDFLEAFERAAIGLKKKGRSINPKEKKIVAYHESGHALVGELTKGSTKTTKVTIVPRGLGILGYSMNTPEENRFLRQYHELIAEVDVLLAGRASERVFLKEISDGASNDLDRATNIIKSMVSMYGMSEVAGLMVLERRQNMFLNGGQTVKDYSDKTAEEIDKYVKAKLDERFKVVLTTLEEYKGAIENMVKALYDKETIDGDEVRQIIRDFEKANDMPTKIQIDLETSAVSDEAKKTEQPDNKNEA